MGTEAINAIQESKTGRQFVLIHGSWHHGGHWKQVQQALEERGHRVYAPTLLGNEPNSVRLNYPLKEIVQHLQEDIVSRDLTDIVLAGHSSGGYIVQQLAQVEPQRVKQVIFINAYVLENGENMIKFTTEETPTPQNNYSFSRLLPFDWFRDQFANLVDEETAKALYATTIPQGGQPHSELQDLKTFFELPISKAFVYLTKDPIYGGPDSKDNWHPRFSTRLGDYKLVEMEGDHEALLTNPLVLAEKLTEASSDLN
ncbi:hypothetical protein R1sor_008748 [Riccia sorocarpa]|uniref:AB hydrolase-1 domain-containing protein n=1 Tax=Riccia sorocarpa TaxID=122646 RepID=A0ABD3HXV7_9MARC